MLPFPGAEEKAAMVREERPGMAGSSIFTPKASRPLDKD